MKINFPKTNLISHILIWCILIFLPFIIGDHVNGFKIGATPGWLFSICNSLLAVIFYGNAFYLYPKFYTAKRWPVYLMLSCIVVFCSIILKFYVVENWFPGVRYDDGVSKFIIVPSIICFVLSGVYRSIKERLRVEYEQKDRQATQTMTELKFLRSQVNPHFLFNVLTNMVSLARKKSNELENALIMLSNLMRYMLYHTDGKKVELTKEITYIENYIALQELRFGEDVDIKSSISIKSDRPDLSIEPMLLIPFVENAFKHGTDLAEKPIIELSLSVCKETLLFSLLNKYEESHLPIKADDSGIGIENVKTRLNMLYPGKHKLTIEQINNFFSVILIIQLA